MNLKSLKIFCDVVRRRSFSRAADDNDISQSGASQVVHQLEERLGVQLIDRSKRPLRLTAEGQVYYDGCRKLVQRYTALEEEVRTLHSGVGGRVSVAAIYSVGLHRMDRCLKQFLSLHPKANIRLEYLHPHRVYEAVESDQADLGLVSYPRSTRDVESIPWCEEPMVLVCHPEHRFAPAERLPLEALHGERMVGFVRELTIRRKIDRALQQCEADVEMVMEFDNIETIKQAVEIGAGVALLPITTIGSDAARGSLAVVPLAENAMVRPLGIIHRRGKQLGATALRFIELLLENGIDKSHDDRGPVADNGAVAASARQNGTNQKQRMTKRRQDRVGGIDGR